MDEKPESKVQSTDVMEQDIPKVEKNTEQHTDDQMQTPARADADNSQDPPSTSSISKSHFIMPAILIYKYFCHNVVLG